MKEIDQSSTAILLASLDRELDLKCLQLKERQKQKKFKKVFFLSCLAILVFFSLQVLFGLINLSFLFSFFIYQVLALSLLMPLMLNLNGRSYLNE